jgi:hypothetical protein
MKCQGIFSFCITQLSLALGFSLKELLIKSSGFHGKKLATPSLTFELKLLRKSFLVGAKVLAIL